MQELTGQQTPQQAFEENIRNRLRKDIGDLLPPEVLSSLIDKAMNEMFFKRELKPEHSGWNAKQIQQPSWFDKEVKTMTEPIVRAHLTHWLETHREDIEAVCMAEITNNGPRLLASLFVRIITNKAGDASYSMVNDLANRLREKGVQV